MPGIVIAVAIFSNVAYAFLLLLGWAAYSFVKERSAGIFAGTQYLPMFALAAWFTLAQFWSDIGSIGWFTTWIFLTIPLAFLVWQSYSRTRAALWHTTQIFLGLLGCLAAVWAIFQIFVQGYPRAMGPLADPNTYGCLLNLLWFPLFAHFITAESRRAIYLCGLALQLIHLALMMSGSRAASLIWLLLFIMLAVAYRQGTAKNRLIFVCIMAAGNYFIHSVFSSNLAFSSYGAAFDVFQSAQPSASPRLLMWLSTIRMWLEAPWLGSGLGSWSFLYPVYRIPDEAGTTGYYAHNDYLQLLQEGGIVTAMVFIGVMGWLGLNSIKIIRGAPSRVEEIGNAGIVAGIAAAALHASVNFTFYLIYINVLVGIYLGKLFQAQGSCTQETYVLQRSLTEQLIKVIALVLIVINGFHAILSSTGLIFLRSESPAVGLARIVAPQLSPFSAAVLLTSVRPSDTAAQRYIVASIENSIANNSHIAIHEAKEMLNEAMGGYELLRKQNKLDASIPAGEAGLLISFDKRYGVDSTHTQRTRELLQESLRLDPSRMDSAILLASTYFDEGRPQEAYNLLARAISKAWRERDRMIIEAEILKHQKPEYTKQLSDMQEELRSMRVHCRSDKCGERYTQIVESAREVLRKASYTAPP